MITKQQKIERFKQLPADLRDAFTSEEFADVFQEIVIAYDMSGSAKDMLSEYVLQYVLGMLSSREFESNLSSVALSDRSRATELYSDVSEHLLGPLKSMISLGETNYASLHSKESPDVQEKKPEQSMPLMSTSSAFPPPPPPSKAVFAQVSSSSVLQTSVPSQAQVSKAPSLITRNLTGRTMIPEDHVTVASEGPSPLKGSSSPQIPLQKPTPDALASKAKEVGMPEKSGGVDPYRELPL